MDQSFKKLRDKWYKKIKDLGFEDIEDVNSKHEMLYTWDSLRFMRKHTPEEAYEKQRYYTLASHFINYHKFNSALEKHIWILHTNGLGVREIAKNVGSKKDSVHKIVARLRTILRRGY